MRTLSDAIRERLLANASLVSLLTGGIIEGPLVRDTTGSPEIPTPGTTPTAFSHLPPYRIKPVCVVPDEGEDAHPSRWVEGILAFPRLWFYAPNDPTGRATLGQALMLARTVMRDALLTSDTTVGVVQVWATGERMGTRDSPEFSDAVFDVDRYQAVGLMQGSREEVLL